jgi:membrane protease YdiL (CAAX protease family)
VKKLTALFLALAFGISWSIYAVAKWGIGVTGPIGWTITSALFMFGPAIAALVLRKPLGLTWPDLGVVRHGIRWKWMGIAVLIGLSLPVLAIGFNWLLGEVLHFQGFGHTSVSKAMIIDVLREPLTGSGMSAELVDSRAAMLQDFPLNGPALLVLMLAFAALAGCTVNFVFAMGEELGWRGILFHSTRRFGWLRQVLFTGLVWGLWHAPLIHHGLNYPEHPWSGIAFMCLFTTALALPLAWVRFRSGCVWSAGVLHGTVNAAAGITVVFTKGGTEMLGGGAGLSAILGMCSVGVLLFAFDRDFRVQFQKAA